MQNFINCSRMRSLHGKTEKAGCIQMGRKYFTLSFDDGITQDIKIMDILRNHGTHCCSFNINSGLCGANWSWVGKQFGREDVPHLRFTEQQLKDGIYDGFEVLAHTLRHPSLATMDETPEKIQFELIEDAKRIESLCGKYPLGFAWPGGGLQYNEKTVDIVSSMTDMHFARTIISTHDFCLPEYFLTWHSTCSIVDDKLDELTDKFIEYDSEDDMLFYVWGHGYELDIFNKYEDLDRLVGKICSSNDIIPVTNGEFYNLFKDRIPSWKC